MVAAQKTGFFRPHGDRSGSGPERNLGQDRSMRRPDVTIPCAWCTEPFHPATTSSVWFCSKGCAQQWSAYGAAWPYRSPVAQPLEWRAANVRLARCGWCGAEYKLDKHAHRRSASCSQECKAALTAVRNGQPMSKRVYFVECPGCGGYKTTRKAKTAKKDSYCGNPCVRPPPASGRRGRVNNKSWSLKRERVLERDGWVCRGCGIRVVSIEDPVPHQAHIDHIIPKAMGGDDHLSNLQVLCRGCNMDKADKPPVLCSGCGKYCDNFPFCPWCGVEQKFFDFGGGATGHELDSGAVVIYRKNNHG